MLHSGIGTKKISILPNYIKEVKSNSLQIFHWSIIGVSGVPNSFIYFSYSVIYLFIFFIPEHVYHDVVLLSIAVDAD